MHPYFNMSKINILYYGYTRIISNWVGSNTKKQVHKYTAASNVVSNSANNGGGKLILHYTYNGVANTVTEEMGLSD